ncbi:MAG: uroporphyrinogen decarboxylase family protein [Promethearchaeota archaeon]
MKPKERFLTVFSENRNKLDRVPLHVQGVLSGFIQKNEELLFENYDGDLTFNVNFDAPLVLGFDAVFAGLPSSISCKHIKIIDNVGKEHSVGLNGQAERQGTSFYTGGLVKDLETHERLWNNVKIIDNKDALLKTQAFYEEISRMIFPVTMVGGIFDTTWQSMGFSDFARNYRKNTKFYRTVIKDYAEITRINVEKIVDVLKDRPKIITILDDIAFKGRLMISPERWWNDIGKYYKEIVKIIHDAGMHAIAHSDGDVTEIVPYLMKAGFEGLQGWEGGANPYTIAEKYPDFVTLGWGDVSEVLPFGTREEIQNHVLDIFKAAKENRHLIIGPSTVIFEKIPFKNIQIFMSTAKKHGIYL